MSNLARQFLFWLDEKKWLIIIAFLASVAFLLPRPEGLSEDAFRTLILVFIVVALIISEPIPLPATALLIVILQVLFNIVDPNSVAKSFMSDSVFFIMGSLMIAVAIVSQGLDTRLALAIITITGNKTIRIVMGFVAVSAILASFIGEHTVVAMMLPVALTLLRGSSGHKKIPKLTALLLFSVAYGAMVGSIGTPSGGARNALIIEYLSAFSDGQVHLTYFAWMKFAYPLVIIGIVYTSFVLTWAFKPEYSMLDTAVRKLRVQIAKKGPMQAREWIAIIIFFFTFLGWVFLSDESGMGIIAILGAVMYMITGVAEWKEIRTKTDWGVILLFAGALSLGVQMKSTGAATWVGNEVISIFASFVDRVEIAPYLLSAVMTTIFANIMSSAGTVAVLGPITLSMGGDPVNMSLVTAIASAFGYFSAFAAPPMMMIYSTGKVKSTDFLKAGWRMGIISLVSLFFVMLVYWPFIR